MGPDMLKVAAAVREALSPLFDGVPTFDVPMGADAKSVREMWGLGEARITNLATAMENNGVVLVPVYGYHPKAAWVRGMPVVGIPQGMSPCDRRYAVLRSLGELLGASEEGGERFAREFLMPEEPFRASVRGFCTLAAVVEMKRQWKAPLHVVADRLRELEIVSDDRRFDLMKRVSARGWRRDKPAEEGVDPTAPGMHARMLETLVRSGMSREAVMGYVRSAMPSAVEAAVEEACGLPQGWMSWGKVVAFRKAG